MEWVDLHDDASPVLAEDQWKTNIPAMALNPSRIFQSIGFDAGRTDVHQHLVPTTVWRGQLPECPRLPEAVDGEGPHGRRNGNCSTPIRESLDRYPLRA